ncbi:MAG: hypothetical protein ACI4DP_13705 [Candidatus Ornithomonoglobus sp.]
MRKFVSLLSAAALISSIFVAPVDAGAAGENVLWSDTFDGYTNTVLHKTSSERVGYVLVDGTLGARSTYTGIGGMVLTTVNKIDDSSYYKVAPVSEGSEDMFLQTQISQFSTNSRGAYMQFNETYTAETGKDIVLAFKLREYNSGGTTYDDAFSIGNTIINMHTIGATSDDWHKIKVVVTTSGTSVYIDSNTAPVATSSDISINKIAFQAYVDGVDPINAQRSSENPMGYPTFCFNDMVIYETPDGVLSEVPEAETHEEATAAPTATPIPTAVPIDNEIIVDFEGESDFEKVGITTTNHKDYTVIEKADDPIVSDNTVLRVMQGSESVTSYGYATFDLSTLTAEKSHVILEYDLYSTDGRLKVILQDGALDGRNATTMSEGLFSQGKLGENKILNFTLNTWVHTTVDMDFAAGVGTYKITKADGVAIGGGNIETDIKELTTMSLVSWSPETAYLDNVVIKTGGVLEIPTASPEPASEIEGSYVDLMPVDATLISTFPPADVQTQSVLNHSGARAAQESETVDAYSSKARTNSVYAAFDVLVNAGDELSVEAFNDRSNKLGTTFIIVGKVDGTAEVSAIVDKGDTVKLEGNLVCGTWYRILIEIPQNGEAGAIQTGNTAYTIYRINPDNPSQTSEIAAQNTELTPRNLETSSITCFVFNAVGSPYIDNGVAYIAEQSAAETLPTATAAAPATPEPASTAEGSYIDLMPADAALISTFPPADVQTQPVLNHSGARAAQESETVDAYSTKARTNSVYAAFDVLVNEGDKLSVESFNDRSNKLGTTFIIEGKLDGTAEVSAIVDKGDTVELEGNLVCGTWYRVLIEIPQNGESGAIQTGNTVYTVYRINPDNPSQTSEIAAQNTELTPRNLAASSLTCFVFNAVGSPYIDNGVTYLAEQSDYANPPEATETAPATPEPASTTEGSYLDFTPIYVNEKIASFSAAEGEGQKILNHSNAKVVTGSESIDAYSTTARAYSVYAAFDVLVNSGDTLSVIAYNENSNKTGTTFILKGEKDGTASVSAVVNNGDTVAIDGSLVCGTWYRVVIEIPQGGVKGATKTGYAVCTVYRIDAENPAMTSSIAAQNKELTPRNLANAALTDFVFEATAGAPYIDNGVTYVDDKSEYAGFPQNALMTSTGDGVEIYSKNEIKSAVLIGAVYTSDGQLLEVEKLETISLEAGFSSIASELAVPEGAYVKYFIIDSFDKMTPLCEVMKIE